MQQHPFIFSDEWKYRLARHFAYWIFWWVFQAFLYSFAPTYGLTFGQRFPLSLLDSAVFLTCHIFLTYSLMYFVIPRYIVKGKYLASAAWVITLFILTAAMSAFISVNFLNRIRLLCFPSYTFLYTITWYESLFMAMLAGLRGGITIGGMGAAIKLMKYWYIKEQRNQQLQKENAEARIQLLKAQVHPHFLFNTLNNIYSHTQNTAPVASKLVMGLSDMLRYMLYECSQPLVPLSKELKLVQDYITLERIRYDEEFDIHVDVPENGQHLAIAPLLLLPLIENCFKHGTSSMIDHPWMSLQIYLEENVMHMKLVNGKAASVSLNEPATGGIGISNVRSRLELLYPNKYTLEITEDIDVFIVKLSVQLEVITQQRKKEGNFVLSYHE